jgi:hypothetical protein
MGNSLHFRREKVFGRKAARRAKGGGQASKPNTKPALPQPGAIENNCSIDSNFSRLFETGKAG